MLMAQPSASPSFPRPSAAAPCSQPQSHGSPLQSHRRCSAALLQASAVELMGLICS